MAVNWPPAPGTSPAWPPPEFLTDRFEASDWLALLDCLRDLGFSHAAPSGAERNQFFRDTRDDDGHAVIGRMLVSPDGLQRYPFCVCNQADHRELLVLWPPYTMGSRAGPVSF
jgi:hypothetical protein